MAGRQRKAVEILLYIPNIIGYIRLALIILGSLYLENPAAFLWFYCTSASLDFFDGWAARTFKQQSNFGAWLDVVVDNLSRSFLWSHVFQWGWLISSVEWLTFVCNHQAGAIWREKIAKPTAESAETPIPKYVQRVMANGFKTPLGTLVILGIHVLPIWMYSIKTHLLEDFVPYFLSILVCAILAIGRLVCLSVELWCIKKHMWELLQEDMN